MKIITVLIILICSTFEYVISAKDNNTIISNKISLNIEEIDSIIIRTLEWHVTSFGYLGFNRKAFDKTYDYVLNNPSIRVRTLIYYIKIEDELSLSLLIAMFNNLQPYINRNPHMMKLWLKVRTSQQTIM